MRKGFRIRDILIVGRWTAVTRVWRDLSGMRVSGRIQIHLVTQRHIFDLVQVNVRSETGFKLQTVDRTRSQMMFDEALLALELALKEK